MRKVKKMSSKMGSSARDFQIVCVGGSAGGLDACIRLLQNMPNDMGVAIAIVNHITLMPTHLPEVLPRFTTMPVDLIKESLLIEPNRVFIIPENRDLHVFDGEFHLKPISKPRGWPDVITVFLRSLTRYWDGKLIAVIVSGYDGDGAAALCGIKQVGGIPSRRNSARRVSQACRKAPLKAGASILFCRQKNIDQEIVRIARVEA
jgi:two-component system chemotaxis response regulator CheB